MRAMRASSGPASRVARGCQRPWPPARGALAPDGRRVPAIRWRRRHSSQSRLSHPCQTSQGHSAGI
eukprot:76818-Lingulodinium_polyedra.AAC.1